MADDEQPVQDNNSFRYQRVISPLFARRILTGQEEFPLPLSSGSFFCFSL
jgi:hypothetical protein